MSVREQYGVLFPRFWEGTTGRQIQGKGRDAVILAAYLASCRHANMIGLYELPIVFLERELTVLKGRPLIMKAFQALEDVSYATYDLGTEHVWVREMARIRLGLAPGDTIATKDNKHRAVLRLYAAAKPNPFLAPFHERYQESLQLDKMRIGPPLKPVAVEISTPYKGLQGASKGLRTRTGTGTSTGSVSRSEISTRTSTGSAAAQTPRETSPDEDDADKNVEVITALIMKEVFPLKVPDVDLVETIKDLCVSRSIAYNSTVVKSALNSALVRRSLKDAALARA